MAAKKYAIGDVVVLRSGSPQLTVLSPTEYMTVVYFNPVSGALEEMQSLHQDTVRLATTAPVSAEGSEKMRATSVAASSFGRGAGPSPRSISD